VAISKNKGGVEKHKASQKHRQNKRITESITKTSLQGSYPYAGSMASSSEDASDSEDEPTLDKVDATRGPDLTQECKYLHLSLQLFE
jgi:hypothetical protein